MSDTVLLTLLICIAALLYSTVGHGGASGYLAAMALFGLAPKEMKPTALVNMRCWRSAATSADCGTGWPWAFKFQA